MIYRNSIYSKTSAFSLLIFFVLSLNSAFSQTDKWIDKNEDENYQARHECSFVQAGNKFIMFGGREKAQRLDVYDYKTNTWNQGGKAPKQFNHFQATAHKGFVWIIGSFKTNKFPKEIPADYVWLYHPPTKTWIQGPEIPKKRRRGGAGLVVHNDKFYLIGGNTIGHYGGYVNWFDEYDPKTNTWNVLENASQARDHFSAAVINNKLYAVGGRHSGGKGGVFAPLIDTVDVYNFKTKNWSILQKPLPTPRAAPGVAVLKNKLYVMGGEGEKQGPAFKTLEVYSPKTKTWATKQDMHYPRHGTQAIVSGKGIYIAAGSPIRGGGSQHNMEVYSEDAPKGKALIASTLIAPKQVFVKPNSKKTITIKNKGGNTGSFITSVELTGDNNDEFKINSKINYILIDSNDKIAIDIEHKGLNSNSEATLIIHYNGKLKTTTKIGVK